MELLQKKALIRQFLDRCNRYADDQLRGYRAAFEAATPAEQLALADKIGHWSAYRTFNEHAMAELETDRLDGWFDEFEAGH
jgi:hypothetical protein